LNPQNDRKLDNPVWHSLCEIHQEFIVDYNTIKFYHPDYCAFGGFQAIDDIAHNIDSYSMLADHFFIVGEKPLLSNQLKLSNELACFQMLISNKIHIEIKEDIVELTDEHRDALYQLVNLVQPGYFKKKTALLGCYFGIFKEDKLVAVTGERMKMNAFTEVSAVVTHPYYSGKGFAKQLVAHTVNNIFNQNKTPYLHVAAANIAAIQLYERMGFETRREISFWHIAK
jgi:ribosomal protein S18 acetylase RimI-like enzyme